LCVPRVALDFRGGLAMNLDMPSYVHETTTGDLLPS